MKRVSLLAVALLITSVALYGCTQLPGLVDTDSSDSELAAMSHGGAKGHLRTVGWTNFGNPDMLHTEISFLGDTAVTGSLGGTIVRVSDVSDPATPTQVGTVDLGGPNQPFDVKTNGNHSLCPLDGSGTAAVCDYVVASTQGGSVGAHLIDISTPSSPSKLDDVDLSGISPNGSHNSFLWGDLAFVGGLDNGNVRIYDVSGGSFSFLTEYNAGRGTGVFVHDLFVQKVNGRLLLYLANVGQGLEIVDVSNPSSPQQVAYNDYNTGFLTGDQDFVAHYPEPTNNGDYTFIGDETGCGDPGGIHVFDTSNLPAASASPVQLTEVGFFSPQPNAPQCPVLINNPALPIAFGGLQNNTNAIAGHAFSWTGHNFDILGDRLYHGDYNNGVNVFDITHPANPTLIANKKLTLGIGDDQTQDPGSVGQDSLVQYPFVWQATSNGNYIYASDVETGLYVLELVATP